MREEAVKLSHFFCSRLYTFWSLCILVANSANQKQVDQLSYFIKVSKWKVHEVHEVTCCNTGFLFKSTQKLYFIIPNVITEDYKAYEDIEEEETNEVIIINSTVEDDDPEDKTLVPDDAKDDTIVFWPKDIEDDNFVFLAPSSQEVRFLKEREQKSGEAKVSCKHVKRNFVYVK